MAFSECFSLTNVMLISGLSILGANMFLFNFGLSNIVIPSTITSIGIFIVTIIDWTLIVCNITKYYNGFCYKILALLKYFN